MKKLLWLDDLRDPFDPKWNTPDVEIHWVKSYLEFIDWIDTNGLPDIISFDHDLADEHYTPEMYWDDYEASKAYQESQNYTEMTGYECAKELVEYCYRFNKPFPEYKCHSANPVGRDNILGLLNNAVKHFQ